MKSSLRNYLPFLLVSTFIFIAFYYLYDYAVNSPYKINPNVAKKMIQNKEFDLILDVRTDLELQTLGYYPGSVHIQSADLKNQMHRKFPNKNINILAYCNSGQRARKATEILHELGYKNALYIATPYTTIM
uniref:Rhodanese domain-containing protein n=1 Tax=viral metagenome TaxID=1070528 RepID=A0A6C0KP42_9ZZZZ